MFNVHLAQVCEEIEAAFSRGDSKRVDGLLWPALDQAPNNQQLWFYAGSHLFRAGRVALAERCFDRCVTLDPNPLVMSNLGASFRRLNQHEAGKAILEKCLDLHPEYEPALVNLGSMWVNEGQPAKGIPHLEKAVALGQKKGKIEHGAEWNLGLLYLESARFGEGFDIYRKGYGSERLVRNYAYGEVPEPKRLEPEDHVAAVAGAALKKPRPTLIVWGEQGIGDEMMYATILNDAMAHYEIIFECHPRLEKLYVNSRFANRMREEGRKPMIFPTRKEGEIDWPEEQGIIAHFKCPIADLACFYRRDLAAFKKAWQEYAPFYSYNQGESDNYRAHLEALAKGRPIVGIAAHGGVLTTARNYRTIRMPELVYLLENTAALFVSLDYDDMTPYQLQLHETYPHRFIWFASIVQHWDYDHTAALLAATDMNVMVCQSVAHLSAGIGAKTRVLTPKRTAWREILTEGDQWYWWPGDDVKLYMQKVNGEWKEPLDRVVADIRALSAISGPSASAAASASLPSAETSAGAAG